MTIQRVDLALDPTSANYFFTAPLEGNSYRIWLYYNERMEQWIFNLSDPDDNPIVMGEGIVPQHPIMWDYGIPDLTGFFWLEPIGKDQNETNSNPFEIWKYYTFHYYYDDGVLEE